MKPLILGLGNDIISDDAIGLIVARELRSRLGVLAEVKESSESGFALLDLMIGYEKMLVVDSVRTGVHSPGTILDFRLEDIGKVAAPSPHYAGLPELISLAKRLDLIFPSEIAILAMEVKDAFTIAEGLTQEVRGAAERMAEMAQAKVEEWIAPTNPIHHSTPRMNDQREM